MKHESDPDERGGRIKVKAPRIGTKKVGGDQGDCHGGVEGGLGEPEAGLGFENCGVLFLEEKASSSPNGETDDGVGGKNNDSRQGSVGGYRVVKVPASLGEDKEGA